MRTTGSELAVEIFLAQSQTFKKREFPEVFDFNEVAYRAKIFF